MRYVKFARTLPVLTSFSKLMWTKRAHSPAFLSFLFLRTEMITSTLPSTSTTLVKISTPASTMTTHAGRAPAPLPQARPCPTSVRFLTSETFSGMSNKLHPLSPKTRSLSFSRSFSHLQLRQQLGCTFPCSQQSRKLAVTGAVFSLMCHMKQIFHPSIVLTGDYLQLHGARSLLLAARLLKLTRGQSAATHEMVSSFSLQSRALRCLPLITERPLSLLFSFGVFALNRDETPPKSCQT